MSKYIILLVYLLSVFSVHADDGSFISEENYDTLLSGEQDVLYAINEDSISACVYGPNQDIETISTFRILSQVKHKGVSYAVTSIRSYAFAGCYGVDGDLISVTIPNSVNSIGSYAFYDCRGLLSIRIPSRLVSVEAYTFFRCSSLTSITIPASVTSIGASAFAYCSGMQIIRVNGMTPPSVDLSSFAGIDKTNCILSIPPGSKEAYASAEGWKDFTNIKESDIYLPEITIDGMIYSMCVDSSSVSLTGYVREPIGDLKLPSMVSYGGKSYSVSSIGEYAFDDCDSLISVTLPTSITSIENGAFHECSYLLSIAFPRDLFSVGIYAFGKCYYLSSIKFFSGLVSIGKAAFHECYHLASIKFPSTLTTIGSFAFVRCGSLEIYSANVIPPSVGSGAFNGVYGKLYVPVGCKMAYALADGWKDFRSIEEIEMIPDKSEYKYQPFIMDGTCEWQSLVWRFGVDKPIVNRRVISNEDSVYQGRAYKIIYDYPSCTTDEERKVYVGLIREEDKRVYYVGRNFIGDYSDTEILLYDFSLNVGDTINYRWGSFKVSRIDTVQSFGIWRRMFHFVYMNDPEYEVLDYLLEGIGTAIFQGIVDPLLEMPECCDTGIPCVIHGNEILYKDNTEVDCPCSSLSGEPNIEDIARISFFVRDRQLCIHASDQVYTTLKIYSLDGKLVKSLSLQEQTNEITSSLEGIAPGSYLFIVASSDSQQSGQFIVQ